MGCCCGECLRVAFFMIIDPFVRLADSILPRFKKSIKGEIVLITGSGQGLGKEVAFRLAKLQPILVLWDINKESNDKVAAQLRAAGCSVFSYNVDLTNEQDVSEAAQRVKQEVGDVTLLINNAGVFSGQPIVNLSSNAVRTCFEVNSMSHFWMLQQFLPRMLELNKGHVVAIASIAGHHGAVNMSDYCASKHATVGLMKSLDFEIQFLKKRNIHLTTINPVFVATGLVNNVQSRFPWLLPLLSVEETADAVVDGILKEREEVFIPKRSKCLSNFMAGFSRRTRYRIMRFVNYGYEPVSLKEIMARKAAEIV